MTATASRALPPVLPWALIGAACLGSFAATSSGTTRAPFLLEMSQDLAVSMPLVANLVSLTATAWGITSALGGWLSDRIGRRPLLIAAPVALALSLLVQAWVGSFFWVAVWAAVGGGCAGVIFAEVSGRVHDSQRGRALGWVMSGQSLTLVVGVPLAAGIGALIGWRGWLVCVAARINDDNTITVFLNPQVASFVGTSRDSFGNEYPNISLQNINVVARVKNGETIALGGLTDKNDNTTGSRVPLLSDLPIIGQFFRSTQRTKRNSDLLIFVTPRVIEEDETSN